MKDYNYYKTIADICNERNDVYKKFKVEETMQIEKVVAAVMVVTVAVTAISGVPDFLKLRKGSRLFLVHSLHQISVHLFAVAHALRLDLKCFVEQIISTGDEVNEIADASRCVCRSVKMDMDAAGVVCHASRFTQSAHDILKCSNILPVDKDGADQLAGVFTSCGGTAPPNPATAM